MKRQDAILRSISCDFLSGKKKFTQLELSKELELSLSVINATIRTLSDISAIRVNVRSFELVSFDRLLYYWATHRNLKKDILYQARVDFSVEEIEKNMPDEIAFTGYSGYKFLFNETPSDYSEVYVYADESGLNEIKYRFPNALSKLPNVTVLKVDEFIAKAIEQHRLEKSSVCPGQIFVDLWNMNEWYSKEFVKSLSERFEL